LDIEEKKPLIIDGEIDIRVLIKSLWNKKKLIITLTSIAAIISVLYSLSLSNIYRSQALLAPVDAKAQGMSSSLGGLSGLAGMAGISLPGTSDAKKLEALAILDSYQFAEKFILKHDLMVLIMATKGWDKESNQLIINEKLYDSKNKTWLKKNGKELTPSIQETVRTYRSMVSSSIDKRTGFVIIHADSYSPSFSKNIVDWLINDINQYVMEVDVKRAKNSLNYLNSQINQTSLPEFKQVMAQLIKNEQQTIMLSQSSPEYIFKVIDKPIAPELKLEPKRAMICIVGTIAGFIFTLLIAMVLIFRQEALRN
jgi:uncharacterized protein involved in exopolysaccharide biosynthesis